MNKIIKWSLLLTVGFIGLLVIANNTSDTPSSIEPDSSQSVQTAPNNSPDELTEVSFESLGNDERKKIHAEIVSAEVKARKEAEAQYETDPSKPDYAEDNIFKKHDLQTNLQDQYKLEVYQRYNISKDTALKIIAQGIDEDWEVDLEY